MQIYVIIKITKCVNKHTHFLRKLMLCSEAINTYVRRHNSVIVVVSTLQSLWGPIVFLTKSFSAIYRSLKRGNGYLSHSTTVPPLSYSSNDAGGNICSMFHHSFKSAVVFMLQTWLQCVSLLFETFKDKFTLCL